jgi:hypothetical protein
LSTSFPTIGVLEEQLHSLTNTSELTKFVKELKDDLSKLGVADSTQREANLKTNFDLLLENGKLKPSFPLNDAVLS